VPSNMASDLAGFSARPDSHSCLQNSLQEGFHSQEFGKDAAIPKIPRCLGVAHRDCHRRRIRRRPTSHYSGIISTNHSHSVGSRSANIACTMSLYCATTVLSISHKQNTLHYIKSYLECPKSLRTARTLTIILNELTITKTVYTNASNPHVL